MEDGQFKAEGNKKGIQKQVSSRKVTRGSVHLHKSPKKHRQQSYKMEDDKNGHKGHAKKHSTGGTGRIKLRGQASEQAVPL